MTKKQIEINYKRTEIVIASTLILFLILSTFYLVNFVRRQGADCYQPPAVNSIIDGKINECIEKGGEYSFYYSNPKEKWIFSCVVGGEVEDFVELNK